METQEQRRVRRTQNFYKQKPGAGIIQIEFGFYSIEEWTAQGHIEKDADLNKLFGYEQPAIHGFGDLGWVVAPFYPAFTEEVLKDLGDHELVRDYAGRSVLYFKNRRSGFMPEYVDHPVKDMYTWEKDVKWRLDPDTEGRYKDFDEHSQFAKENRAKGFHVQQGFIGGCMYLRSLMGPEDVLYKYYDDPELIHDCMKTWFAMCDKIIARRQQYVTIDEIYIAEDICYKCGPLVSPDMMREFYLPYYQQLIANIKARQLQKDAHLYIQIDTDGDCRPVIDIYREIGMDYMSPFEVASGCDVVEIGKQYPDLLMRGGIDKRILAAGREAIDREVDRILPAMQKRGGYIPVCDHGVPAEVKFEDYMHYRSRIKEFEGE